MMFTETELLAVIPHVRRMALKLARRDGADDLLQRALCRIWEKRDKYKSQDKFASWCCAITYNEFINATRQHKRYNENVSLFSIDDDIALARDRTDIGLLVRDASRALGKLTGGQREAIRLVSIEGNNYDKAAVLAGIPVGTVRSRLNRARESLRNADIL